MRSHVISARAVAVLLILLQTNLILAGSRNGQSSPNITLVLNQTLCGQPLNHYPVTVVITSSGGTLNVNYFAPNLGEDAVQRLHVFVANEDDKHVTELEIEKQKGSEGKIVSVARLYWAPFNVLRKVDLPVKSEIKDGTWSGTASLPVTQLPPRPSLVNAAMAHETAEGQHWDSYYYVTNPGISIPDLMVLPRYKKINPSILSDETSYSSEWVSQ